MDDQLNHAPCGFLTLSEEGSILSVNQTLLNIVNTEYEQLHGHHVNSILTVSSQLFYQFYFIPLVKLKKQIDEMYVSLQSKSGEEIPVLINALSRQKEGKTIIECVVIPMRRRSEYENELLIAKKEAEAALQAKNKAHEELEIALKTLEAKQEELVEANNQNQKYKIETMKELELARKIQETSLTEPIDNVNVKIEAFYRASSELSGDIYGFYQINDDRYGIILLDVMGHGISSALITMSLHSLFQRLISKGQDVDIVMKELDAYLHNLFQNNEEARHYCTAIYLLIDTKKQEISYINAGHPPALLQNPNGEQIELHSSTPPIGTFEGVSFKSNTFTYSRGGRLLLYTDGVTDPFGTNHLCSLLKEEQTTPLQKLKQKIILKLNDNHNVYHKSDDQCFILVDLK